jgi:hypothetical protein
MSFSSKQNQVQEGAYLDRLRNQQIVKMSEVAPLANTSSAINEAGAAGGTASSPMQADALGGIDFRANAMNIKYEPLGNFSAIKINLPKFSSIELANFNTEVELTQLEDMVNSELLPSGDRLKDVLAACVEKGEWSAVKERVEVLLVKMGLLEEKLSCLQSSSNEYKEALVLADSLI